MSEKEEAEELAKRICLAARHKVDSGELGQRVETPYQRKFKKTYNSVWDVRKLFSISSLFYRGANKMTSLQWSP